jgi:hypothetical protein
MRAEAFALIGVLALITHFGAYVKGRMDVAAEHALEAADATIQAGDANEQTDAAARTAGGELADTQAHLIKEAGDGRREIESFNQAPLPGTVGRDAVVDPRLARLVLCRIERMRAGAEPGAADRECAADRSGAERQG